MFPSNGDFFFRLSAKVVEYVAICILKRCHPILMAFPVMVNFQVSCNEESHCNMSYCLLLYSCLLTRSILAFFLSLLFTWQHNHKVCFGPDCLEVGESFHQSLCYQAEERLFYCKCVRVPPYPNLHAQTATLPLLAILLKWSL